MNKILESKEQCCGCSACYNVCPKDAISMKEDEYGFQYPEVDESLCVECGLCRKVCNFQKEPEENNPMKSYVALSQDDEQLKNSASGGIFAALAAAVLGEGGVVYGVSMNQVDGKLTPEHMRIDDVADLVKLQGSKYVQSDIQDSFRKVKKDLDADIKVLFSGTPCQVDGLKGFLRKEYDNLYTIDIICHGVPNKKMFQDYLALLEKKKKGKVSEFKFRDKKNGWGAYNAKVVYDKKGKREEELVPNYQSSYYMMFLKTMICRENCYVCKYTSKNRVGDITIGDYWGIEKYHPELIDGTKEKLDENKGISCLIVNSQKGTALLKAHENKLKVFVSEYTKVAAQNEQLNHPSNRPTEREAILELYRTGGYVKVENYFQKVYNQKSIKDRIKGIVPKKMKQYIKKARH